MPSALVCVAAPCTTQWKYHEVTGDRQGATCGARGISRHGTHGRMSRNPTFTFLRERKPQAAHVQAAGNETSIEGARNLFHRPSQLVAWGHATSCVFPRTRTASNPIQDLSRFTHSFIPLPRTSLTTPPHISGHRKARTGYSPLKIH